MTRRRAGTTLLCLAATLFWTGTASAQLDPLYFAKRVPPTVIIVVDTSLPMLEDGNGNFYDPNTYSTAADVTASGALGLSTATSTNYRRIYRNLQYENTVDANTKFEVTDIVAVPNTSPSYATFWEATRLQMAKRGIEKAVGENAGAAFRWGLLRTRQSSPAWRAANDCDKPVRVTANATLALAGDSSPCGGGGSGKWAVYPPKVAASNHSIEGAYGVGGAKLVVPAAGTASTILTLVGRNVGDALGLIPAGVGTRTSGDRPLSHALDDARQAAIDAMTADTTCRACRNTIVVLITAGKDDGSATYLSTHNVTGIASTFAAVTASGTTRRVPIHVIGVKPPAADEAQLNTIATNSGGRYHRATSAAEVARAINVAVQHGFGRSKDVDGVITSEFLPVSPIVGTVNLENARDATGASLPNTAITAKPGGQPLPQRSNVLVTAGFSLPGFDGRLRAFRSYKPVEDSTKPMGWKFVSDMTRLWRDLDGRPTLAGMARTPADANARNIYTFIPDGSGGGSVVAFSTANAALLTPHMAVGTETSSLISYVRSLPLGAIIGSTPALMDPPSLDPAPDTDYGRSDAADTFAGRLRERRSIIFYGGNDGMIHAIDARTGYEVWAFIPYNLLPKLRTLADGQPFEQFDYFVDSSPKIAEVKLGGEWRSLLIIGQGNGGTFYQAFDVTHAGMGVAPDLDDLGAVNSLLALFDMPNESIQFKWSFPNYSSFDPAYSNTFTVTDGTPGGKVKVFGDVKATATYAEKTVGYSWSDPAVGPLDLHRSVNAVIVGSGYFPDIEASLPGRGGSAPKAGNVLYLINADTGKLIGNASGATCSGTGCLSVGDANNAGGQRKNALQADPTAAGDTGSFIVNKAFLGDIDGKYWRFGLASSGAITKTQMIDTSQPIYGSSALLFVGSVDVYMFFATGSDILPANAPGGTGTFKLYGLKNGVSAGTTMFAQSLAATTNTSGLATGERPTTAPSVAGDIVFFTTTVESAATPCADFTANLYAVTYSGGAAYDSNGNGKLDKTESTIARTLAGRATAPFIVDQHLYVATTSGPGTGNAGGGGGANIEKFGDPEDYNNGVGQTAVRILSWREIR
jgi:hypothetical protein